MKARFLGLVLILSCFSCTPLRLSNLVGKDSSAVLADFGPPTQVVSDGKGGNIWIYTKMSTTISGGYQPAPINTAGMSFGQTAGASFAQGMVQGMNQPTATTNVSHRMVYLDGNGIVYNWSIANP